MSFLDVPGVKAGALDAKITELANDPDSEVRGALTYAFVPKWKPTTAYLAGDKVLSPTGDVVSAKVDFTSGASYNAANWDLSASYLLAAFARFAPAPSGGNDLPVLQSLVDSLGSNGGTVWLRDATYLLDNTLINPNKVTVRGQGRSATYLKASASFPINTPVVQLGPLDTDIPIHSYAFATRLENLTVDANNIAGSTAVYAERLQEQSGLFGCVLTNFKLYGANFNGVGNADFGMERCEVYPATGATYGVYFNGSAGSNFIRECTVGVQGSLTAAVYVKNATLFAQSLHMENCTDGLVWDGANGTFAGVSGPTTAGNVTNLVRMLGNSRYVSGIGVTKNSCTNAIKDEFFSRTITDAYVPLWVGGDAHISRLNHVGDKLGFFSAAQTTKQSVTGAKGSYSASTSLVSALATYGLVADSTTAFLATKKVIECTSNVSFTSTSYANFSNVTGSFTPTGSTVVASLTGVVSSSGSGSLDTTFQVVASGGATATVVMRGGVTGTDGSRRPVGALVAVFTGLTPGVAVTFTLQAQLSAAGTVYCRPQTIPTEALTMTLEDCQ